MPDSICSDCGEPAPCECLLIGTGQPYRDYKRWLAQAHAGKGDTRPQCSEPENHSN